MSHQCSAVVLRVQHRSTYVSRPPCCSSLPLSQQLNIKDEGGLRIQTQSMPPAKWSCSS